MRWTWSDGGRPSWRAGIGAAALTVGVVMPTGLAGAAPTQPLGRVHLQAAPQVARGSHVLGAIAAPTAIAGTLALTAGDPQGLSSLATAVSTPGSAHFHHFLGSGEFRQRFGPSAATISAVQSALGAQGLTSTVSENGLLLSFHGTAGGVERAFGTQLSRVALASGSTTVAPTTSLSVPASLSGAITGVVGLGTVGGETPSLNRVHQGSAPSAAGSLRPATTSQSTPAACPDAAATATRYDGLTDTQIAHSYGADSLFAQGAKGQGQSVAVFELEPFAMSDVSTFESCYFGDGAAAQLGSQISVVPVMGGVPQGPGSGESELDIENVLALAPLAHIDVYEAPNSNAGVTATLNQIVQDEKDKVISTSWGQCEESSQSSNPGLLSFENTIFEQAAAQGQTTFAAAGDAGSADCARHSAATSSGASSADLSVDDPASQPYVVGVGGTTTLDASNPPSEATWNHGSTFGAGGGGVSEVWTQPSWQATSSVAGINDASQLAKAKSAAIGSGIDFSGAFCAGQLIGTSGGSCRQVPDVSANADDFTGAITVFEGGSWWTIGGTSSAAPIWAALMADTASLSACASGSGLGYVAPELYALASNPVTDAASFNDTTTGTNDASGANGGLFPATAGFDMATGLGTPKMTSPTGGVGLGALLCSMNAPARPSVTGVTPSTVSPTGSVGITIHGTGFFGVGAPDVAGVQVGSVDLAPGSFTVTSSTSISAAVPALSLEMPSAATSNPVQATPFGAGRFVVIVTSTSGQSSSPGPRSLFDYVAPGTLATPIPTIIGIESDGGPQSGGRSVTIAGEGFDGATSVRFGSVASPSFHVISPTQLTAVVPSYDPTSTACAPTGTNPTNDVCQTSVVVAGPGGTSTPAPIAPPLNQSLLSATALTATSLSALISACGCEVAPATSEYDYFPSPVITSVSVPGGYLSENGGGVVVLTGSGFDSFAVDGVVTGDPSQSSSWQAATPLSITPTSMIVTVTTSFAKPTLRPSSLTLAVATAASPDAMDWAGSSVSPSNTVSVPLAGIPRLTGLATSIGSTAGGTEDVIAGLGLADVNEIDFNGVSVYSHQASGTAVQTAFSRQSDSAITFTTPASLPGPATVSACTATGCASLRSSFRYFSPGTARIESVSQSGGPASGGNTVTISGVNLGCTYFVSFGGVSVPAHRRAGVTGCGSAEQVTAVVPAGRRGHHVAVQVLTLEGVGTKSGSSALRGAPTYTYR